ncbi:MAG: hypothetical protein U1E64_05265 [Sphingomonadaceae bacterium]
MTVLAAIANGVILAQREQNLLADDNGIVPTFHPQQGIYHETRNNERAGITQG